MARTVRSVERKLREALESGGVHLRTRSMADASGMLVYPTKKTPALILLDPVHGGMLENVVHELLHLVYADELKPWGLLLEEAIVLAVEDKVVRYINRSKERQSWWKNEIARRLP